MKLEGVEKLVGEIRRRAAELKAQAARGVEVGFDAPYAGAVHENLLTFHPNGQAKFLEQPARQNARIYEGIIYARLKAGDSLQEAGLAAGEALLKDAQALVPVRTGALRDSGYVRVE